MDAFDIDAIVDDILRNMNQTPVPIRSTIEEQLEDLERYISGHSTIMSVHDQLTFYHMH
jgi:hypothetical protein